VFTNLDGTGQRGLAQSVNLGSSTGMGLDLFFRFSTSVVSGWGSYSLVDFERQLRSAVSGLPQISRHNVRLGTTVVLFKRLSITPSLVLRSTPENLTPFYENAGVSLDTPHEINLSVVFTPIDALDAWVNVRNASHRRYALRGISGPRCKNRCPPSRGSGSAIERALRPCRVDGQAGGVERSRAMHRLLVALSCLACLACLSCAGRSPAPGTAATASTVAPSGRHRRPVALLADHHARHHSRRCERDRGRDQLPAGGDPRSQRHRLSARRGRTAPTCASSIPAARHCRTRSRPGTPRPARPRSGCWSPGSGRPAPTSRSS
jgi:hypothetical protein